VTLLLDATTAQHARGIGTVIRGILGELPRVAPAGTIVVVGPDVRAPAGIGSRTIPLAGGRVGRLLYQRVLLPFDASRQRGEEPVDRVLLLDAYAPVWRPQSRVRYASLVHDVLPLTHPALWPPAKRLVKRTAFATLRRARPTLFTSTEHNARQIQQLLGLQARVVRFGCGQIHDVEADAALENPLPERHPYLVYVGALEPRKDLLSLIVAFEQSGELLDRQLRLTIVGNGEEGYVRTLRERVARSPSRERIELMQHADRDTTLGLISGAAALVFPSLAEGFGLPILEALALGTPAVASDIPEISSWAGDSILYVPPGQPTNWVAPIEAAVNTDTARRRAGQTFARNYRWLKCAEDLLDF
jgi:glycosyltransferase involved in cell wall biosynthesis